MKSNRKGDLSEAPLKLLELELSSVVALSKALDTPRSLTVKLLIENQEWTQLMQLDCDPLNYRECDIQRFADDHLISEVLKKNPRIPLGVNRKNTAIRKWVQAERRNGLTNRKFREHVDGSNPFEPDTVKFLHSARAWMSRILGPLDLRVLNRIEESMRFGPGSTTLLSGSDVRKSRKYSLRTYACTPDLVSFRMIGFPQLWKPHVLSLEIARGSELTTVPKNAKIDRPICIEPDLNIYVQLGIGTYLKSRLRALGLDLSDQSRNQKLAQLAKELNLVTMDLSSASDLIAHEVVKYLLPRRWFELLCFARCDLTKVKGHWVRLEKFSSMGNGYTFELETAIFYSVLLALSGRQCSPEDDGYIDSDVGVYGDDLIFPAAMFDSVSSALDFLGFKVNAEKTFGAGLFYESCGKDFFNGVDVRPFYLRTDDEDTDFEEACYLNANAAVHYAGRLGDGQYRDIRILPFWLRFYTAVKPNRRFRIPKGFGDDRGFIACRYELPDGPRSPWGSRFRFRMRETLRRYLGSSSCSGYVATLAEDLSGLSQSSPTLHPKDGGEELRGVKKRPVTKRGRSHEWPQLGPWL